MEKALGIAFIDFPIPLWQFVSYIGLLSFFMLVRRVRACFVTSYLFSLYWSYAIFGAHFFKVTGVGFAPIAAYALFGFVLTMLLVYALFFEFGKEPSAVFLSREIIHSRKALLKRIDKMEKTVLNESQSRLRDGAWRLGEIQPDAEAKLLAFRPQLEKKSAGMGDWKSKRLHRT